VKRKKINSINNNSSIGEIYLNNSCVDEIEENKDEKIHKNKRILQRTTYLSKSPDKDILQEHRFSPFVEVSNFKLSNYENYLDINEFECAYLPNTKIMETTKCVPSNIIPQAKKVNKDKKTINKNESSLSVELKSLKQKYAKLEKEFQNIKKTSRGAMESRSRSGKQPRKLSEDIKHELVNKINKLTLEQKKLMRGIITQHYLTHYRDSFEFNINTLPRENFLKLKKYVEECIKQNLCVDVPIRDNAPKKSIQTCEKQQIQNISPVESTMESDSHLRNRFIKKNMLLKNDDTISSLSCKFFIKSIIASSSEESIN
jgi:hypothetical protein